MSNPKVSIIFPFYNCEKYIEEALASMEYLKSDDFEIIAINDGSTDKSVIIAWDALGRFSIDYTLISMKHRQGCFSARMRGIKVARGQFIAFADADDVSIEGRFEKQLKYLEDNRCPPRYIDGCGGWAEKIDENGQNIGLMDYPPLKNEDIISKIKNDPTCNPFIDPTMMIDKAVIYHLGYRIGYGVDLVADMDLWLRALKMKYTFHNIQEPLIKYRVNPEGNTQSHQKEMIRQHVNVRNEFIKGI